MDWSGLQQIFEQNKFVIIGIAVFMVLYFIVMFFVMKRKKAGNDRFLAENPDAARIYLQHRVGVTSETMSIFTVDGAAAHTFFKKGKSGVYVRPGQCALEVEYNYQRPGVMHRIVTESTGRVKKVVETEANGAYILGFDRKAGGFTFVRHQE